MSYADLLDIRKKLVAPKGTPVLIHHAYGPIYGPGWEWDDLPNRYAAPVSAFSVDQSSFELWTDNGKLFFQPANYGAKAYRVYGQDKLRIEYDPRTMVARVSGPLPPGRARVDTLALPRPDLAAGRLLGSKPKRISKIPATDPTYIRYSPPMSVILKEALPSSDNNITENLLLMASKVSDKDDKPYDVAEEKMGEFLTSEVGLEPEEFTIRDGSGLSRHNFISASALAKLLVWADEQPTRELWHSILARPGQEGTLKNRLEGVPFEGKTGTMEMVSALSGYLRLTDGKQVIVALLVNGQAASTAETRDLMDDFIKQLLEAGNGGTLSAESNKHEGPRPNPRLSFTPRDRLHRSRHDGRLASQRVDSGDEPIDAVLHRAQRVALRVR
jgi:D-alanyl-D-alanine carboxypeptidase/D-alanyl-D-alanine-endopeptidase (penicillin-binding protein 4)